MNLPSTPWDRTVWNKGTPNPESGMYEPFPEITDYVWSFYNETGIYPIQGLKRKDIVLAIQHYICHYDSDMPFCLDSEIRIDICGVLVEHFGYPNPYDAETSLDTALALTEH